MFYSVPADAPEYLAVDSLNSTAIHVEWSPPLIPNGVIIFYTIYINDAPVLNITATDGTQNASVGGLSPNQMVHVSVSASTSIGEGPLTVPQSVVTHESGAKIAAHIEKIPVCRVFP